MNDTEERRPRKRMAAAGLVALGLLAGGILAGSQIAGAAGSSSSNSSTTSTSSSTSSNNGSSDDANRMDPSKVNHGPDERLLTGQTAAKVKAAALKEVPGATVIRVETDSGDAVYEAHLQKADGSFVTVLFDKNFNMTGTEEGFGPCPGGMGGHPGPGGPGGSPPGNDNGTGSGNGSGSGDSTGSNA
jgi:hypothetical protein